MCRPLSRISWTACASPWETARPTSAAVSSPFSAEQRGQRRRPTAAGRGRGVAGERRAAGEGLEAAGVAAGAGRAEVLDPDVADVAGAAVDAAVELAVDDDAAADAGADLDEQEVLGALGDPGVLLPHRQHVDVVVEHDRAAELAGDGVADRVAVPAGHDRRRHRDAAVEVDRTGYADAGAHRPGRRRPRPAPRAPARAPRRGPPPAPAGCRWPGRGSRARSSRPSVTPTDMPVAPIEIPTNRMSGDRSTRVERRPPRDAAGPASWASPSSASRATSAAIVVRETWSRSASWAFDSAPSSRSWARIRACIGLSARPARE